MPHLQLHSPSWYKDKIQKVLNTLHKWSLTSAIFSVRISPAVL